MSDRRSASDVSGVWTGEYWYDEAPGEFVLFAAQLTEADGYLSGTTIEPATFDDLDGELTSVLAGERSGKSVTFTKLYDPRPGLHQVPIDYVGEANEDLTIVEGFWIMFEPQAWRGRFRLRRVSSSADAAERLSTVIGATFDRS